MLLNKLVGKQLRENFWLNDEEHRNLLKKNNALDTTN
jgi:hypothetical protein